MLRDKKISELTKQLKTMDSGMMRAKEEAKTPSRVSSLMKH